MGNGRQRDGSEEAPLAEVKGRTVGILGLGAVGSLLAVVLSRAGHRVVGIATPRRGRELTEAGGLRFESDMFGSAVHPLEIQSRLAESVDLLLIATKAPDLERSLDAIDPRSVSDAVVVTLLNGVGHSDLVARRLGVPVVTGMIGSVEVAKDKDGVVRQLSRQHPHVDIACDSGIAQESLAEIAHMLDAAGLSASVRESEAAVIWRKLARLNAIASTTAAFQVPVGAVRSDPKMRALLEGAVSEACAVARAEGVDLAAHDVCAQIDALPAGLTTSLQRDVAAGRPSEAEWIPGGVLRIAERHGIAAPAIETLYALIQARLERPSMEPA